jgi:hypothetical protein
MARTPFASRLQWARDLAIITAVALAAPLATILLASGLILAGLEHREGGPMATALVCLLPSSLAAIAATLIERHRAARRVNAAFSGDLSHDR